MNTGLKDFNKESHETMGNGNQQPLGEETKQVLTKVANTIRTLSMDAVQKANSGHPGLPLGCAEIGAYMYGIAMKHNPKNPNWMNRDRLILSAGHGSMWLYSCLHLSGFDLSLEELKNFRQLGSKTPGHPEFGETDGVETTTGPLGQGFGNAVGQALGLKLLGKRFNTTDHQIIDGKVFALAGDGCFMEGISSEVSSLAGHMKLDNLIVFYDSNNICLDGPVSESLTEDTAARYRSYGWDVVEVDGHDFDQIHQVVSQLRQNQERPVLIVATTIIAKGSPNKAGTHKAHGAPLGPEEVAATKEALGLPQEDFYVPQAVQNFFENKLQKDQSQEQEWQATFEQWTKANPDMHQEFEWMSQQRLPDDLEQQLTQTEMKNPIGGRKASNETLQVLAKALPQLYGGSADLSCSDLTMLSSFDVVKPGVFNGRNIKYGVREFGMATMATGMAQTGLITPFIGTFFTFSDYMRNAIRLAALMKTQVVYQFTHDSVLLGEDGPTHQPVEHLASLRAMPDLQVMRPSGNHEVKMAWLGALRYQGPTVIVLSRQNIHTLDETCVSYEEGVGRGAYIVKKEESKPDFTLFSTGSELPLAMDVAKDLEKLGKQVRVVSVPCWELFEKQSTEYKESVVGGDLGKRACIEAGTEMGWHKFIGLDGVAITVDTFGLSAPAGLIAEELGFTTGAILEQLL